MSGAPSGGGEGASGGGGAAAPDKRTAAYENIFGRPTAKPKGPQPIHPHPQPPHQYHGHTLGYAPGIPPQAIATHAWVHQQALAGGSAGGGGALPNVPGYRWNPAAGGSYGATPAAVPQRYAPTQSPAMLPGGGIYAPINPLPGSGGAGATYADADAMDKRASLAPSVSSQASSGSAMYAPSHMAGAMHPTSAADAYAASVAMAGLPQYGNGWTTHAAAVSGAQHASGSRVMSGSSLASSSTPHVASASASASSLVDGDSTDATTATATGAHAGAGADMLGVDKQQQADPPRLPSIDLHGSSSEEHWFQSRNRGGNDAAAADDPSIATGVMGLDSRVSALRVGEAANGGGSDGGGADASPNAGNGPGSDGRRTPTSPLSRPDRYIGGGYQSAVAPAGRSTLGPEGGYGSPGDLSDGRPGLRSAASSIYEGRARRGSIESDRQSVVNAGYPVAGQLGAFNGSGFFPPYAAAGYGAYDSWGRQPQRMRTTSTATQAAQAAYAPGYAEANPDWRQSVESAQFAGGLGGGGGGGGGRFDHRAMSAGQPAQSRSGSFVGPGAAGAMSSLTPQGSTGSGVNTIGGGGGALASPTGHAAGAGNVVGGGRRGPVVYPALLSRVAEAFKQRVTLAERTKDGLTYTDTFDGREAVDRIAYIIKTTDRNLALLLGRALDAQKFFHDVTYDHRLRDSPNELYQFRVRLATPFGSEHDVYQDAAQDFRAGADAEAQRAASASTSGGSKLSPHPQAGRAAGAAANESALVTEEEEEEQALPTGVFTLLTDCYSPTCTRDRLCYSIACPRRLEQQARLNMKPQPILKRSISRDSLMDVKEVGALWAESVSKEVLESVSDQERKRQELINEVIYTERDFVHDLEYLRDTWIKPLRSRPDVIPPERRDDFVTQVFWNVLEIHAVNSKLAELLTKRQKQQAVVERVGDVLLEFVPLFQPFVKYGAHQLYGKYEFEKEKASNPAFARFVEETERLPESRKLELNGYLTKPTTRLARYPLLLEAVIKATPEDNADRQALPKVIKIVKEFLAKVNAESGKSENRFNLAQLDQQLVFKQGEAVDLRLRDEQRELVFKGPLKKRGGTQSESAELQVFLFDHALLMVKAKTVQKHELYKVFRKPIPLELLIVTVYDEVPTGKGNATRPKSIMSKTSTGNRLSGAVPTGSAPKQDQKTGYALTFTYLGRKGYSLTLWASTFVSRRKWFEHIEARQEILRQRSNIFDMITLSDNFFLGPAKVNCSVPFDFGRRIVYGTDDGVYLSDLRENARPPTKVLPLPGVTQIDVLEEYQILIVLAERSVHTFTLDALDPSDPMGSLKRGRRISSHTSFFRAGQCLGRTLVCVVKSSSLSSTIKTLEPIEQAGRGKKQPTFRKLLQGGQETLRVFKEFYIPTESSSIHFLKSKLCVGCTKGFEIVDLETLDTQGLLDPADANLDFVQRKENVKPIAIYRIGGEFLLCYDEFAFYVNKNGWRAKGSWIVHWEGNPTAFALHLPYVLAFEPSFIEVRHVETGALHQVITGYNLRCLFADVPTPAVQSAASSQASLHAQRNAALAAAGPYGRPMLPIAGAPPPPPAPPSMFPGGGGALPPPPSALARSQSFNMLGGYPGGAPAAAAAGGPMGGAPPPRMGAGPGFPPGMRPPAPPVMYRPGVPFAFTHAAAPRPQAPPRNPVWESVAASRNQIVFMGDTTVFCVRPAAGFAASAGAGGSGASTPSGSRITSH